MIDNLLNIFRFEPILAEVTNRQNIDRVVRPDGENDTVTGPSAKPECAITNFERDNPVLGRQRATVSI